MIYMKESYSDLSYESREWLNRYIKWGILKNDLGLTEDIVREFKEENLQLQRSDTLYRGISIYNKADKIIFKEVFKFNWDEMEIGEIRWGVLYRSDRITSWTKSEKIAIQEFGFNSNSYLITNLVVKPEDSIIDTTLIPDYIQGFQQDEVILKPGNYKCILKRVS